MLMNKVLKPFVPLNDKDADKYFELGIKVNNKRQSYSTDPLYVKWDEDSIKGALITAIRNNKLCNGDLTKMLPNRPYVVVFRDSNGTPRGLSLIALSDGVWYSNDYITTLSEYFLIRLDNSKESCGIARASAEVLKMLVDKGVADRATSGASSEDSLLLKNAFEKMGFKTTFEFSYTKQ